MEPPPTPGPACLVPCASAGNLTLTYPKIHQDKRWTRSFYYPDLCRQFLDLSSGSGVRQETVASGATGIPLSKVPLESHVSLCLIVDYLHRASYTDDPSSVDKCAVGQVSMFVFLSGTALCGSLAKTCRSVQQSTHILLTPKK